MKAFDTPWKIWNEIWRFIAYPRVRLSFAWNQIPWGDGWRFYGVPIIQRHRQSAMRFGSGLQLRSSTRSNPLAPNRPVILATWEAGALLSVGNNFAMTGGSICAAQELIIGDNVAVGANCTIMDTDFHPIDSSLRSQLSSGGGSKPVSIGDNVFIGMNCLILKGVTIGENSVIGAGSVVVSDIPPDIIAGGNPARIICSQVK